jgi:hypothetical protein
MAVKPVASRVVLNSIELVLPRNVNVKKSKAFPVTGRGGL